MKQKYSGKQQYITMDAIGIDYRYQRRPDKRFVSRLAQTMNIDKVGVLSVAKRADGSFWIIDGQHRLLALREMGAKCPVSTVPCWVYSVSSVGQEADLFAGLNRNHKVQALDEFKAAVVSGTDKEASEIDAIVRRVGWKVGWSPNEVSFVKALRKMHRMPHGAHAIELALRTAQNAYGKEQPPVGHIAEGLGKLYGRFNGTIDTGRMAAVLAQRGGGQARLVGDGRTLAEAHGGKVVDGVAEAIRIAYNKGLRTNKLPAIRTND